MDPEDIRTLSYSQVGSRARVLHARLVALGAKHRLSKADEREAGQLTAEVDLLDAHRRRLERADDLARGNGGGRIRVDDGSFDPYSDERGAADRQHDPARGVRDRANRVIGGLVDSDRLPARAAETVEALTRTGSMSEQSWAARMAAALGDNSYLSAFSRLVSDPQRGHLMWNAKEQEAFRVVENLRSETRAMSTIDTQGGYLAPLIVDPSILISGAGSINPLRAISRGVTTVSDQWNGITSAGVTSEWLTENAEVGDDSPTLSSPSIPIYKSGTFVPFSIEIGMDAINFTTELSKLLTDGYLQLTNQAFTVGTGIGQPTGIITALANTATSVVNTATGGTLVSGDPYATQNALASRFSAKAQFCANLGILNTLRQFTTGSNFSFPELRDNPQRLLARDVNELSNMTGTVASGSKILLYGDFEHFVICDRWPSQLELIQTLFGPNRRPTGQRGAFLWARVGSDVVVPNAFRLLTA
jgi:HK97 family phage major capsid protein